MPTFYYLDNGSSTSFKIAVGPIFPKNTEYYAKLVADSDAATGLALIAFQERVPISTGSGV